LFDVDCALSAAGLAGEEGTLPLPPLQLLPQPPLPLPLLAAAAATHGGGAGVGLRGGSSSLTVVNPAYEEQNDQVVRSTTPTR